MTLYKMRRQGVQRPHLTAPESAIRSNFLPNSKPVRVVQKVSHPFLPLGAIVTAAAVTAYNTAIAAGPESKLANSFIAILTRLTESKDIERLWLLLLAVTTLGIRDDGVPPADKRGIVSVAAQLGVGSVASDSLKFADLSEKARDGLTPGTEPYNLYIETYLAAAADRAKAAG